MRSKLASAPTTAPSSAAPSRRNSSSPSSASPPLRPHHGHPFLSAVGGAEPADAPPTLASVRGLLAEWVQPQPLAPGGRRAFEPPYSPDSPGADIHAALNAKGGAAAVGAVEIGRGAFARIYAFSEEAAAEGARAARVRLDDIVLKVGSWQSAAAFDREVALQDRASTEGCAPRVLNAHRSPSFGAAVHGLIAMDKLCGPTLLRLLFWHSRDARRQRGVPDERNGWRIDPSTLDAPLVRAWRKEAGRVQAALFAAGIEHGDWHDRNLVFDVPEARQRAPELRAAGEKALKHVLMAAIEAGPAAGRARLLAIDFGCARELRTALARACAPVCAGRRLPDLDEEAATPITPRLAVAAALEDSKRARPTLRRAQARRCGALPRVPWRWPRLVPPRRG